MNLDEINLIICEKGVVNPRELSPLTLAYIGDGIFEMLVRLTVLTDGNAPVNKLNSKARKMVNAKAQNDMYFKIVELLTDEEMSIFKRGRNAKSFTTPKNANLSDYRHATGLEALFGFLYLSGEQKRMMELFSEGTKDLL